MPIPLPNLDDRRFAELVEEGKRLIPGFAPSWTDHNASDPGITFIELFALIAEMLMYRVDRISEVNKRAFLRLLTGDEPEKSGSIDAEIQRAVLQLRTEERAVTLQDFERLAMKISGVVRAYCLPLRNLESGSANAASLDVPAHVSVIVIPDSSEKAGTVIQLVKEALVPRCLLTTRLHVVLPRFVEIGIRLTVHIFSDRKEETMRVKIQQTLERYFDALAGGVNGTGWPFGQSVYISELYALLDQVDGVDYVERYQGQEELFVIGKTERSLFGENTKDVFLGQRLESDELVKITFSDPKSMINIVRGKTEDPV